MRSRRTRRSSGRDAASSIARASCIAPIAIGFDGIEVASWTQPAATTVEQPIDDIAETAVEAL